MHKWNSMRILIRIGVPVLMVFLLTVGVCYYVIGQETEVYTHFSRGLDYLNRGMLNEAIAEFNKAIEINPGYASAYNNRGLAYYYKGQYDQAISDYSKAIEINPRYSYVYFNKAAAYEKVGRIQEAVEAYKSFIQYAPSQSPDTKRAKQRIKELENRPPSPIRHRRAND